MLDARARRAEADDAIIRAQMATAALELARLRLDTRERQLWRTRDARTARRAEAPRRPIPSGRGDDGRGERLRGETTAAVDTARLLCADSRELMEMSRRLGARSRERRRERTRTAP